MATWTARALARIVARVRADVYDLVALAGLALLTYCVWLLFAVTGLAVLGVVVGLVMIAAGLAPRGGTDGRSG